MGLFFNFFIIPMRLSEFNLLFYLLILVNGGRVGVGWGGWLWHINLWGCWPGLVLLILVGGGLPVLGPGLFAVGVFVCLFVLLCVYLGLVCCLF